MPSGSHDPNVAVTNSHGQSGAWSWQGDPGFRSVDAQTLNANPGVYLLPLYKAYNSGTPSASDYAACPGQGSNYYYNIVDFVPVMRTISSANCFIVISRGLPRLTGS